jgi:excisionase family DNA binding protein
LPTGIVDLVKGNSVPVRETMKTKTEIRTSGARGAFKVKEACEYLGGISPVTLRRLIARGLIGRHPALRHILISKTELDLFLQQSGR